MRILDPGRAALQLPMAERSAEATAAAGHSAPLPAELWPCPAKSCDSRPCAWAFPTMTAHLVVSGAFGRSSGDGRPRIRILRATSTGAGCFCQASGSPLTNRRGQAARELRASVQWHLESRARAHPGLGLPEPCGFLRLRCTWVCGTKTQAGQAEVV